MTPVIKWLFVLVLVTITVVTVITIMINHTMELEKISEDQNLTEVTSAGYLMAPFNSVSIRKIYM